MMNFKLMVFFSAVLLVLSQSLAGDSPVDAPSSETDTNAQLAVVPQTQLSDQLVRHSGIDEDERHRLDAQQDVPPPIATSLPAASLAETDIQLRRSSFYSAINLSTSDVLAVRDFLEEQNTDDNRRDYSFRYDHFGNDRDGTTIIACLDKQYERYNEGSNGIFSFIDSCVAARPHYSILFTSCGDNEGSCALRIAYEIMCSTRQQPLNHSQIKVILFNLLTIRPIALPKPNSEESKRRSLEEPVFNGSRSSIEERIGQTNILNFRRRGLCEDIGVPIITQGFFSSLWFRSSYARIPSRELIERAYSYMQENRASSPDTPLGLIGKPPLISLSGR